MKPDCKSCLHSMMGNDLLLRCRIYGFPCSPAASDGCAKFCREPGTDAAEAPWYSGGWCVTSSTEGRGD